MPRIIIPPGSGGGGGTGLTVVEEFDFTTATATNLFPSGTYAVNDTDGALIATVTTNNEAALHGPPTSVAVDAVNGTGIVIDCSTTGAADNYRITFPFSTADIDFDNEWFMVEILLSACKLTAAAAGNLSALHVGMANEAELRATRFTGAFTQKVASRMEYKVERYNNNSANRSAAVLDASLGDPNIDTPMHIQIIGAGRVAQVYMDDGTAFAEPYTMGANPTYGYTGQNSQNAFNGAAALWSNAFFVLLLYIDNVDEGWDITIQKVRTCKFSPPLP